MKTLKNGDSQQIAPESARHIKQVYQLFFIVAISKLLVALLVIISGDFDSQRVMQIIVGLVLLGLGFAIRANGRATLKPAWIIAIGVLVIETALLVPYVTRQIMAESGQADFGIAVVIAITSPRIFFNSVFWLFLIFLAVQDFRSIAAKNQS